MKKLIIQSSITILMLLNPVLILAQSDDSSVESLYDKFDDKQIRRSKRKEKKRRRNFDDIQGNNLSQIYKLEPFNDIAVIQRRYLPKTGRFEFSLSGMSGMNNAFFNNLGIGARFSYHFYEEWGVELDYFTFSASKRDVTKSLEKRSVKTSSLVTAKSYVGASLKWAPIYGKMSFLNKSIVPFDMHFLVGGGQAKTEGQSVAAFHAGTGQTFAISKSMAVRWDLVFNFYQPEVTSTSTNEVKKQSQTDLYFAIGWSMFFPEASYR